MEHLKKVKSTGRDATRSALNELREFGYCHYFEIRKAGKIIENFYVVFENPTPYQIALDYIELAEEETIFYKEIKPSKKKGSTVNGFTVNGSTVNGKPATNNIDNNNIYINNNHDALDYFEKLFKKFEVNFTKTNQEAILKLLKTMKKEEVKKYLIELYTNIKNTKSVKNISALFSAKLKKGERQLNKLNIQIIAAKENKKNRSEKAINILEQFNTLDEYEKLKIEEQSIEILKLENLKELFEMREKNYKNYLEILSPGIEKVLETGGSYA